MLQYPFLLAGFSRQSRAPLVVLHLGEPRRVVVVDERLQGRLGIGLRSGLRSGLGLGLG